MAIYHWISGARYEDRRHLDLRCASAGLPTTFAGVLARPGYTARGYGGVPTWSCAGGEIVYCDRGGRVLDSDSCPHCLFHGDPLPPEKQWGGWRELVAGCDEVGIYEIADDVRLICQIGSGNLVHRLGERFGATFKARLGRPNTMWFVYDMLAAGQTPSVRTLPPLPGHSLVESEREWRLRRWREGWQVASLR